MKELICKPIGYIQSPYQKRETTPKSGDEYPDQEAMMEISEEYAEAMADMEAGKKYEVLFWFDKVPDVKLKVPFRGVGPMMGIFSTHAPYRPNPIGASVVTVTRIEGQRRYFTGVDMMDGTPVLDIKPFDF